MNMKEAMNLPLHPRPALVALLVASTVCLTACNRNSPQVNVQDLGKVTIPDAAAGDMAGAVSLRLEMAEIQRELQARGVREGMDALVWQVNARHSFEAIANSVEVTLGEGWQRSQGFALGQRPVDVRVWETSGQPKRYYGLLAEGEVFTHPNGEGTRRVLALFSRVKR